MNKQSQGIKLNRIYQRDCIQGMKMLPSDSIDLIIADPPYNIARDGANADMKHLRFKTINEEWDYIEDFEAFNQAWLEQCYRVLKPRGSILCYGTHHNIFQVGYLMSKIDYQVRIKYEWLKTNPPPSFLGTNPRFATESIIWATKQTGGTYNRDYAHKINDGKNITNVFTTSLTPPREKKFGRFPCQKPLELSVKLINLHSHRDEVVLVPFCGSGTECVAAQLTGRSFVTFEREPAYIELANIRLDNTDDLKAKLSYLLED
ncbi:DNA-methyltransferase [Cohnella terricola]|uniref:Methyltransferase n=1 Tax=Cohnella terricola TaxID=1289167 RepID=A0A559JDL5_9BACL|nr:site-specific DNA-methyltransferase [Cohnella terricola]TVX97957.1 site-specific DNA-methyltransferase [Cohnella terricola]